MINPSIPLLLGGIIAIFFSAIAYGVYYAFGPGSKNLVDPIGEHAKMHEMGIPHGHGGGSDFHRH